MDVYTCNYYYKREKCNYFINILCKFVYEGISNIYVYSSKP